jgi:ABC-type uncharacterized transport system permease subunit
MNVPAQIFLGKLVGGTLLIEFLRQLLWLLAMTLFVRYVTARATQRVVVQGG